METSQEIGALASAFALALLEIENTERTHTAKVTTKTGGYYEYSYSDLGDILSVARPALAKNGLFLTGQPIRTGKQVSFAPRLIHKSGQWIQYEPLVLDATAEDCQMIGSAITYCRKYSVSAIFCMASDADDDGNKASGTKAETSVKQTPKDFPNCPKCKTNSAVIKGKEEFGGGWLCFAKKGGCGEKWHDQIEAPKEPAKEPVANGKEAKPKVEYISRKQGDNLINLCKVLGVPQAATIDFLKVERWGHLTPDKYIYAKRVIWAEHRQCPIDSVEADPPDTAEEKEPEGAAAT